MAKQLSKLRKELEHLYNLSDQLQVQLRVLEEMHASVNVKVVIDMPKKSVEDAVITLRFQVSKSSDDDLRAILQKMDATNKARAKLRKKLHKTKQLYRASNDLGTIFQLIATLHTKQLSAEGAEIISKIDSLGDMSMEKQMRMQMYMDAYSQTASMISNILKKSSDSTNEIIQNMR